jgi:CheY-like chemotaxis protein
MGYRFENEAESKKVYRVLLVEDHEDIRVVLDMMIQAEGFETASVASAEEALAIASAFRPDVIVTDISLPSMDGYQLLKELHNLSDLESVPAIALTGLADHIEQFSNERSHFEAFLSKPIDYDLLLQKITLLTQETYCKR